MVCPDNRAPILLTPRTVERGSPPMADLMDSYRLGVSLDLQSMDGLLRFESSGWHSCMGLHGGLVAAVVWLPFAGRALKVSG